VNFFTKHKQKIIYISLIGILLLSLILRIDKLNAFENMALGPDAIWYKSIASKSTGFYDTGIREPFFVFLIKLFINIFGAENFTLRYLTVFLSMVSILLTFKIGKELFGSDAIGLMSAFFTGVNHYLIFMSVRLLRLELFIITILLLFYILFINHEKNNVRYILIGIFGGIVCLTRITSLSFVIPFIIYIFWREKISYIKMIIPITIITVMVLPHFIHNKKTFGSYAHSVDIHAKWYRNREFKDKPGFPTSKELAKNSYTGRPITSFEYIFGMHSIKTVVKRSRKGFSRIFLGRYRKHFFSRNDFLVLCLFCGYVMILFTKYRFLWGIMIFLIGPTSFLAGTLNFDLDPRLIAHIYPFMIFITSFFIVTLGKTIFRRIQMHAPANIFFKNWRLR
jgi:4-amino-4-deoxy-L-arabinose transferase-like glycosyltransferase